MFKELSFSSPDSGVLRQFDRTWPNKFRGHTVWKVDLFFQFSTVVRTLDLRSVDLSRSRVRLQAAVLSGASDNLFTHVPLSPSSIDLAPA